MRYSLRVVCEWCGMRVSRLRMIGVLGLWPVAAVWAIAVPFVIIGLSEYKTAAVLDRYGVFAEGRVVAARVDRSNDASAPTAPRFLLDVAFTTAGGTDHTVRTRVRDLQYYRYPVGSVIPLRYSARAPDLIEIDPGQAETRWLLALRIAGAIAMLGAVIAGWRLWQGRPLLRAISYGPVGRATVVGLSPPDAYGRARLLWQDDHGRDGQSRLLPQGNVLGRAKGSVVIVVFDPQTNAAFWIEDLAGEIRPAIVLY